MIEQYLIFQQYDINFENFFDKPIAFLKNGIYTVFKFREFCQFGKIMNAKESIDSFAGGIVNAVPQK